MNSKDIFGRVEIIINYILAFRKLKNQEVTFKKKFEDFPHPRFKKNNNNTV